MQRDGQGQKTIVESARREFAERGYAATSIRDIARAAGMSLSALYHYYPSKQHLLYAILDEDASAYFAACDAELKTAGDDPAGRLEALVTATVRFRVEHPAKSTMVANEIRSLDADQLARFRGQIDAGSGLFRDIIEAGVAAGEFRTPYPEDARRAVIAMCNAIGEWYDPAGVVTPEELVERYITLALVIVEYRPRASRRR